MRETSVKVNFDAETFFRGGGGGEQWISARGWQRRAARSADWSTGLGFVAAVASVAGL